MHAGLTASLTYAIGEENIKLAIKDLCYELNLNTNCLITADTAELQRDGYHASVIEANIMLSRNTTTNGSNGKDDEGGDNTDSSNCDDIYGDNFDGISNIDYDRNNNNSNNNSNNSNNISTTDTTEKNVPDSGTFSLLIPGQPHTSKADFLKLVHSRLVYNTCLGMHLLK